MVWDFLSFGLGQQSAQSDIDSAESRTRIAQQNLRDEVNMREDDAQEAHNITMMHIMRANNFRNQLQDAKNQLQDAKDKVGYLRACFYAKFTLIEVMKNSFTELNPDHPLGSEAGRSVRGAISGKAFDKFEEYYDYDRDETMGNYQLPDGYEEALESQKSMPHLSFVKNNNAP